MRYIKSAALYLLVSFMSYHLFLHFTNDSVIVTLDTVFATAAFVAFIATIYYIIRFIMKLMSSDKVQYLDGQNTMRESYASSIRYDMLQQIENTSIHEAAHAVTVLACGMKPHRVTTVPNVFNGRSGQCSYYGFKENTPEHLMNYMTISLAGDIAAPNERFRGSISLTTGGDHHNALGAAMSIAVIENDTTVNEALDTGFQRARTIVEQNKEAIEHLAQQLYTVNKHGEKEPVTLREEEILEVLKDYEITTA